MDQTNQKDVMEEQRRQRMALSEKFRSQTAPPPPLMTDGPSMMNPNYRSNPSEEIRNPQDVKRWRAETVEGRQIWLCACKTANIGKFCTECGAPGPRSL